MECGSREGQAPKGELPSIPQRCRFQWKLSARGPSSFTLETGTWRRVSRVQGRGQGGGGAAPSPECQVGPRLGWVPPSPSVWKGGEGRRGEGAGASLGPRRLSHPLVIPRKVALTPPPAWYFLPLALLLRWSQAGRSRAETCKVSGDKPASLLQYSALVAPRVCVLRTRHKLSGLSQDICWASPALRG